jgi:hypothetical protein
MAYKRPGTVGGSFSLNAVRTTAEKKRLAAAKLLSEANALEPEIKASVIDESLRPSTKGTEPQNRSPRPQLKLSKPQSAMQGVGRMDTQNPQPPKPPVRPSTTGPALAKFAGRDSTSSPLGTRPNAGTPAPGGPLSFPEPSSKSLQANKPAPKPYVGDPSADERPAPLTTEQRSAAAQATSFSKNRQSQLDRGQTPLKQYPTGPLKTMIDDPANAMKPAGPTGPTGPKGKIPDKLSVPSRTVTIPTSSRLANINNNPGNLKYAKQTNATKGDNGFAKFKTPEEGFNALIRQVAKDAERGDTIESFIKAYAPESENDTAKYIEDLANILGVDPSTKLDTLDLSEVAKAVARLESNTDFSEAAADALTTDGSQYKLPKKPADTAANRLAKLRKERKIGPTVRPFKEG